MVVDQALIILMAATLMSAMFGFLIARWIYKTYSAEKEAMLGSELSRLRRQVSEFRRMNASYKSDRDHVRRRFRQREREGQLLLPAPYS